MAIGPIGNAIYTNQQIPYVASLKADHSARFELQNIMAQHIVNEEEKKIQEVREPEESHGVDPDREHQQHLADEKQQKHKKRQKEQEKKEEPKAMRLYHLDIKV